MTYSKNEAFRDSSSGYLYNVKIKILHQSKKFLYTIKKNYRVMKIRIVVLHRF